MINKINAGYGFQLCQPDDPERTHWHCGCECNTWNSLGVHGEPGSHRLNREWRKPIPLPDNLPADKSEWELVPESYEWDGKTVLQSTDGDGNWYPATWAAERIVIKDAIKHCLENKKECSQIIAFARHKEPEREALHGWMSIKQRLPRGAPESKWLCFFNYGENNAVASQTLIQIIKAGTESCLTHWMPIPAPPKAPVDDGERLAKQYAYSLNSSRDRDCAIRDYMAGYAAGLKSSP